MFGLFSSLPRFIEISVFNANSVDPNQTPRSVVSDAGLPCLSMSLFGMIDINGFRRMDTLSEKVTLLQLLYLPSEGGGRMVRRCPVSCVTEASNSYWLTVGQGLLSL